MLETPLHFWLLCKQNCSLLEAPPQTPVLPGLHPLNSTEGFTSQPYDGCLLLNVIDSHVHWKRGDVSWSRFYYRSLIGSHIWPVKYANSDRHGVTFKIIQQLQAFPKVIVQIYRS